MTGPSEVDLSAVPPENDIPASRHDGLLPGDVASTSARLIQVRWLAGTGVLIGASLSVRLLGLPLPEIPLVALGVTILFYNLLLLWLTGRAYSREADVYSRRIRRLVLLQVALDWMAMAVFLHLTGGLTSPAIPFFLIHMLIGAILFPESHPLLTVSIGLGALVGLALAEATGVLPNLPALPFLPADLYRQPLFILAQIGFFGMAAAATVVLSASIMDRLRERERQVAGLLQATQAVSSTLSLPQVLERLARNAARVLSTGRASIRLLDETGERLNLAASYGLRAEYQRKGPVELSRSPMDREVLSGTPVIVNDVLADDRLQYPDEVIQEGILSILVVPIVGRTRPLGVLRVYADQPRRFTPADADYVTAIAREGAVAIENAQAHEALQRADQARAQFVRTVTHELRSPVGGAQSLLRVMLGGMSGEMSDKQKDIVARVLGRLDRLMALIGDLLALAATKTMGFEERTEAVELKAVVKWAVEQHAAAAKVKRVGLRVRLPPEKVDVRATHDGLAGVLENLIGNAVKYTPADGQVEVRVGLRATSAEVVIADTGMGIPRDEMAHLWEEFFRASNARHSGIVGTGLGLSIVKRLVDSFGGLISVQSEEGRGTTFTVVLPLETTAPEPARAA